MARPSKLGPQQWESIERRMSQGEKAIDLAREFGINPSQITRQVSQITQKVRNVAQKLAEAQTALAELPPRQQYSAVSLAEKLQRIVESVTSAVELGAKTGHRMHALANTEACRVDDSNPLGDMDALKGVAVLTKIGNEALAPALSLIAANKDRMAAHELGQQQGGAKRVKTLAEFYGEGVGA